MQQLHLVGFTTDNDGLIFSARKGAKSGSFVVAVDDRLVDAVEAALGVEADNDGDDEHGSDARWAAPVIPSPALRPRPTRPPRPESLLTPREMQARLRAGRSIAQVAREAGVDEEWVERFANPVFAEQFQVVTRARTLVATKARLGESSQDLGTSVLWNLADRGIRLYDDEFNAAWSAQHFRQSTWIISFQYTNRKRSQVAEWELDLREGGLIPRNRLASDLGYTEPGRRRKRLPPLPERPAPKPPTPARAAGSRASRPATTGRSTPTSNRSKPKKSAAKKRATARAASTTKTPAAKKLAAKKVAAKKVAAKKLAAKKVAAKKLAAKKVAAKKLAAKKVAAKKLAAKKVAAKKLAAKKVAAKKLAAKKVAAKKLAAKKVVAKKAPATKSAARAAAAKKGSASAASLRRSTPARSSGTTKANGRATARSTARKAQGGRGSARTARTAGRQTATRKVGGRAAKARPAATPPHPAPAAPRAGRGTPRILADRAETGARTRPDRVLQRPPRADVAPDPGEVEELTIVEEVGALEAQRAGRRTSPLPVPRAAVLDDLDDEEEDDEEEALEEGLDVAESDRTWSGPGSEEEPPALTIRADLAAATASARDRATAGNEAAPEATAPPKRRGLFRR